MSFKKLFLASFIILLATTYANASYDEALELFLEQRYKKSLKILAEELDIKKDMEPGSSNYKLRYLAAHNHWKLGNTGSVIAHFKRCIDIDGDNPDPLIDLALFFLETGRFGDARFFANKALGKKKEPLVYYILGGIYLGQRNNWKAKEYFEKAISFDPELSIAYNGLGITLMNLKKYSEANTAFSAALTISPNSSEILNNIATSLKRMGKLNESYGYYAAANAKDPESKVIKKNMEDLKTMIEDNKNEDSR